MQVYIQVYNGTEMIPTNLYTFVDKLPLNTHQHQHMKVFELHLKLFKFIIDGPLYFISNQINVLKIALEQNNKLPLSGWLLEVISGLGLNPGLQIQR